ncbi:Tether containing UBX domain for GLUT4 [Dissophora globulifera]|uniref:Tether containing UBX domain for GLUT4 n=1 Tax=Dissophora globulifera TaxID=979702 RepID=A0A9P6RP67_9FUNG|nr:Tether containing UBX domain for GLUT4 [Dissophora globulifera]
MASNLTVFLGGGKKQLVKTTPTMILRQVVNTVCEKQSYPDPESYGLKSGKNFLDLSLSIRYANIAPGAKLELARVPKDKSAPTHVDLALQLEDGGRVVKSFAITTTLWDVLLGFETASNGTLNLTQRSGVPQSAAASKNIFSLQRLRKVAKPSAEVYLLPVVILLEREYVSIPTLKTTTLQLAGLLKGNAVFRVMMRFTDATIEDFMEDIQRDYSRSAVAASNAAESTEASSSSSSPSSESSAVVTASPDSPKTPVAAPVSTQPPPSPKKQASSSSHGSPHRQFTTDKTAGERDFMMAQDAYHGGSQSDLGINIQGIQVPLPGMTNRSGGVESESREGPVVAPGPSSDINIQRQTPTQDMNAAMIEASQEIRQLREQQTQAALTDRVKKLSKSSDSSDRDRFVRSLPPGAFTEEPQNEMDIDPIPHRSESPTSTLPDQDDVVRQIAHRVSMQLKEAQQRGDSMTDYHSLIAQEIEREQRAGVLPSTPTESRNNSIRRSKDKAEESPLLIATPDSKSSTTVEEPFNRNVKVFRPPADNATPLSNQIDLPDDFYTLTSQDVMKLMNGQKAKREEQEKQGFKTAAVRAEEEKARERRYPKTIIRIRFPDRVQLQATFRSQETVGDLRKWVTSACVGQGEKFDLYTTPPKKILANDAQTLYQAGLAPQSIVYFSWADSKLNQTPPFLNGAHMALMEDLPIPGQEPTESKSETQTSSTPEPTQTVSRTGSIPPMTQQDRRLSARMSTDKPGISISSGGGSSGSGGGLPKWMKLSKK